MISNGPSRSFTHEAVLAWFGRLCTTEWEKNFSGEQLKMAQKYYREGYLSTVDIQENQAIVTKKINREETYSVVEWNGKGPEIRTSMDDEETGIALATAGLYEIEELISELQEEDPLLGEAWLKEIDVDSTDEKEPSENDNSEQKVERTGICLCIRMEVSAQKGLRAIPEWANSDHSRMPVYSKQAADLEDCDRPALMRFVAEAGKYGFEFQKESGEFLLSDWKKVAKLSLSHRYFQSDGVTRLPNHWWATSWAMTSKIRASPDLEVTSG